MALSLFCALFAGIYERFSHGVWSFSMVFAFAWPLAGGALPALVMAVRRCPAPRPAARWLWRAGLATLAVGSLFRGALEIYGTSNRLTAVYPIVGFSLCAAAALRHIARLIPANSRHSILSTHEKSREP